MLDKGGLLETMGPGSVISVSSTCTPDHVKMLAERAREKGVDLLDAPICRGQMAADTGTMLTLCGGSETVFERAEPILRTFCSDIAHLGDVGAGPVRQGAEQLPALGQWRRADRGRPAERSQRHGPGKLRDALLISSGASDALKNWENVSFTWALKDMQIVIKMADKAGLSLPIAGAIKELVKESRRIKHSNPPDWTGRKR